MSHTNQTPNYHLPQFIGTDKPAWLVDFNQAMSDIDTQMKANETAGATAEANAQSALSGVGALNSQVSGIQTSVTALEAQAPLDEAQIETNGQNIATNAQNIVDLDNRMGHTSITGIGDGTATGAIAEVKSEVGDLTQLQTTDKSNLVDAINEVAGGAEYSEELVGDGTKTYSQILDLLYTKIDSNKITPRSVLHEERPNGTVVNLFLQVITPAGVYRFSKTEGSNTGFAASTYNVSNSGSTAYGISTTTTPTITVSDDSSAVFANGSKIKIMY